MFITLYHDAAQSHLTPLHTAADNGNLSVVKYLIASGAYANAVGNVM